MTQYGIDVEARTVVALWATGGGSRAAVVAAVPGGVDLAAVDHVAQDLSDLSDALWWTYEDIPDKDADEDEHNEWDAERAALDSVAAWVGAPGDPGADAEEYGAVEEASRHLGQTLRELGDPAVTAAVVAEVRREVEAVRSAECGDLSGRAVQAVALSRPEASPLQVAAADDVLARHPLGDPSLFEQFEPAAACVAAAHWLAAAAVVASSAAQVSPVEVFAAADDIRAGSVEVPASVVSVVLGGEVSPREVVRTLLSDAVIARAGGIPSLDSLLEGIAQATTTAAELPEDLRSEAFAALVPDTVTPLDPANPARDLLAHLLDGIDSCLLLFEENTDTDSRGAPVVDGRRLPHPQGRPWRPSDDEASLAAWAEAVAAAFERKVRAEAAATRDRLL